MDHRWIQLARRKLGFSNGSTEEANAESQLSLVTVASSRSAWRLLVQKACLRTSGTWKESERMPQSLAEHFLKKDKKGVDVAGDIFR